MNFKTLRWAQSLFPVNGSGSHTERLRAAIGALIGIFVTGALSAALHGPLSSSLWLIAPMGASAVLLFGLPTSALAHPWSIVGGNFVAAIVGVTCAKLIDGVLPAAAIALFFTIVAMFTLHCLHPPSGAVALTAVLGGADVHAAGFGFVLAPVMLNSLILVALALAYNNVTRNRYHHSERILDPDETQESGRTKEAPAYCCRCGRKFSVTSSNGTSCLRGWLDKLYRALR